MTEHKNNNLFNKDDVYERLLFKYILAFYGWT